MAELISTLEAPVYVERVALNDNKNIMKAREAVKKALDLQKQRARDLRLWRFCRLARRSGRMSRWSRGNWVDEKMMAAFPLGVYRDRKPEIPDDAVPQMTVTKCWGLRCRQEACNAFPLIAPAIYAFNIAGFGGQGVLLLGEFLAEMGMRESMEVSWLPAYGPEMRSGSAHCYVCLANERIGSPLSRRPDVLIAMNEISLHKFAANVTNGGTILYNRDSTAAGFLGAAGERGLRAGLGDRRQDWLAKVIECGDAGRDSGSDRVSAVRDRRSRVERDR